MLLDVYIYQVECRSTVANCLLHLLLLLQGGLFGNGAGGGGESPLGGLGGSAMGMTISAAHKHMLQAQPSLRDPSKGVCVCVCVCVCHQFAQAV